MTNNSIEESERESERTGTDQKYVFWCGGAEREDLS